MIVFDIEQLSMLLELEAPFGKDELQLARRRMAKRWHPDIAPPGKRQAHEDHLKAINSAADQLGKFLENLRGGVITATAIRASADAARRERAEQGRRNYEQQEAQARYAQDDAVDPFGSRLPDHSVVYRYARCNAYPEWGVGSILGIYFLGEGDAVQQWARVTFERGVRTVPAGTLEFVDFGKPSTSKERARRFLLSAEHAMAEGDFELAARRLIFARDADESDPTIHRLMTVSFWQANQLDAAARSVRAWIKVEPGRPAPHRYAARLYESMALLELAAEACERECATNSSDPNAWARLGNFRLRLMQPEAARSALERARVLPAVPVEALLDLALAAWLEGDGSGSEDATRLAVAAAPEDCAAWVAHATALDRTGAINDCIVACERALVLGAGPEVAELLERKRAEQPSELVESAHAA